MLLKYRNFQKRLKVIHKTSVDGAITQICVGGIFSAVAYHAYQSEMIIIAVPLGLFALSAFISLAMSVYFFLKRALQSRER